MQGQKTGWIKRVASTYNFHAKQLQGDPSWTLRDTASALNRSLGGVGQDVKIGSWLVTHRTELEKFKNASEAIQYIRQRQKKLNQREFDA